METESENRQKQEADRQTDCTTEAVAIVMMTKKNKASQPVPAEEDLPAW